METNELKQYLKDVYELESQIFSSGQLVTKYNDTIEFRKRLADDDSMGAIYNKLSESIVLDSGELIPFKDFNEYDRYLNDKTYKEASQTPQYKTSDLIFKLSSIVMYSGFILGAIAVISMFLSEGLLTAITVGALVAMIIIGIFVGIANFLMSVANSMEEKAKAKIFNRILSEELVNANEYNEKVCDKIIDEYNDFVVPTHNKMLKLLEHVYEKNIIHPKYRDFVAISQIYEYIDTGRCTELEGPNGAYNLYESELRQNTIIDRLDVIINQLEQLNRTMRYVANAVNQTNTLLNNISYSLDRIEANTALTAYNTQVTAYYTKLATKYDYSWQ